MSLLQEALKRKELDAAQRKPEVENAAERDSGALPSNTASLSAGPQVANGKNTAIPRDTPPQSMPVLALPQSAESQPAHRSLGAGGPIRRKASLLWVIVAAITILTGLTVAAGFVFFIYRCLPPVKTKIGQQAYHIDKRDTIAAGGTNIVIGQPMPADKQETVSSTETITHQFITPDGKGVEKDSIVTAARTQTVAVMQNAVQQESIGDTTRKPVSIKPTPVRAKAPPASSLTVSWPALKLTGILRGSGPAESTALINGNMISAGQMIDGVTVVEIKADGVLLRHGAEKRFLRVGTTLY